MTSIQKITFRTISRPLRITFSTALGSKAAIQSVLVRVRLSDGISGEGEVPTSFAFPNESVPVILQKLNEIAPSFCGTPVDDFREGIDTLRRRESDFPMTVSGLEVALFRAWLKKCGRGEFEFWGGKKNACRTDVTIPFVNDLAGLSKWIDLSIRAGFTEFKIKTGGQPKKDLRFIQWIDNIVKEKCEHYSLRLDGNQAYDSDSILRLLEACDTQGFPIDAVEQPLPAGDFRGLRSIRGKAPFPIILDEGVRTEADLLRVLNEAWCDGVNIKIAKSGIAESGRIMRLARRSGLKLMIGCMTETMTGLSAAIFLAAGTGLFDFLDIDSIHFLFHKNRYGRIELNGPDYIVHP